MACLQGPLYARDGGKSTAPAAAITHIFRGVIASVFCEAISPSADLTNHRGQCYHFLPEKTMKKLSILGRALSFSFYFYYPAYRIRRDAPGEGWVI